MNIRIERVQGEERNGFYVQPMMKRVWAVKLDMLKVIDLLCRRHHIKYFAQWGTLLGAVRHRGFIPWDDDIDIAMLREDFQRFQYYAKTELPGEWEVRKVSPTLLGIANSTSIRLDQEFLDKNHGCPYILGVDLIVMDAIPRDPQEEGIHRNLFWAAANLYERWESFEEDCEKENAQVKDKWLLLDEIENLTGHQFDRQGSVKDQLYELADSIAAMYWDAEYEEVAYLASMCKKRDNRIPRPCFDRIIEVPFENTTIPILRDYDLLLRLEYGDDYMVPIEDHSGHEYPIFRKQMGILRDYFEKQGLPMPECFDMELE